MTFGKHTLSTPSGGMDEYLAEYTASTILNSAAIEDILAGIEDILKESSARAT
jgi:hypothetical protein